MNQLYIVGIGPGNRDYILPIAIKTMEQCEHIIASKRLIPMLHSELKLAEGKEYKIITPMGSITSTIELIQRQLLISDVALVVSGDPLMYSLFQTFKNNEIGKTFPMQIIPGIGSLQMLGAVFGYSMEDAKIISVHGRDKSKGSIAQAVYEHKKVFFLCSREQNPAWISQIMINYQLDEVMLHAGSNLSYENELMESGHPKDMITKDYESLCVVMVINPHPKQLVRLAFLEDEDFIRAKTPMTKEEIRILIIHRLKTKPDSILWDIGAGTGSVSIECARQCPFGEVYAVEQKNEALDLIEKNKEKFNTQNLHIHKGKALEVLKDLPVPDMVFIGGSGGELEEIIKYIIELKKPIRIVIAAVTMETLTQASQLLSKASNYNIMQIGISKSRELGNYHIMDANNPVTIVEAIV